MLNIHVHFLHFVIALFSVDTPTPVITTPLPPTVAATTPASVTTPTPTTGVPNGESDDIYRHLYFM